MRREKQVIDLGDYAWLREDIQSWAFSDDLLEVIRNSNEVEPEQLVKALDIINDAVWDIASEGGIIVTDQALTIYADALVNFIVMLKKIEQEKILKEYKKR